MFPILPMHHPFRSATQTRKSDGGFLFRRPFELNRRGGGWPFFLFFLVCAVGGEKENGGVPTRTPRKPGLLGDY